MLFILYLLQIIGITIIYLLGITIVLSLELYMSVKFSWWETVEFHPELVVLLFIVDILWPITLPIILIGLGCVEVWEILFKNNKKSKNKGE